MKKRLVLSALIVILANLVFVGCTQQRDALPTESKITEESNLPINSDETTQAEQILTKTTPGLQAFEYEQPVVELPINYDMSDFTNEDGVVDIVAYAESYGFENIEKAAHPLFVMEKSTGEWYLEVSGDVVSVIFPNPNNFEETIFYIATRATGLAQNEGYALRFVEYDNITFESSEIILEALELAMQWCLNTNDGAGSGPFAEAGLHYDEMIFDEKIVYESGTHLPIPRNRNLLSHRKVDVR